MAWKWTIAGRVGGAVAGLLLAGCGSSGGGASSTVFVGRITGQGQDAVVGAVTDGATVSFYVCGGPSTFATETRWILGSAAAGGALDLTGNGWHVTGDLEAGSGKVETDLGATLLWTVRPATGEVEGVYQVMDGGCRTGAVVGDFGDGEGTRLQGTWCDGASHYAQVTPIKNPLTFDGQRITVQVEGTVTRQLVVARLQAPLPPH